MTSIPNIPEIKGNQGPIDAKALKEANPFKNFDTNGDGKIKKAELTLLHSKLPTVSFDSQDEEAGIDEAAYNEAFMKMDKQSAA